MVFVATSSVEFLVAPVLHLVDEHHQDGYWVSGVTEFTIIQWLVSVFSQDVGFAEEFFPGFLDVGFGGQLVLLVADRTHRLLHLLHRFQDQPGFDLVQRGVHPVVGLEPGITQPRIFTFSYFDFC